MFIEEIMKWGKLIYKMTSKFLLRKLIKKNNYVIINIY